MRNLRNRKPACLTLFLLGFLFLQSCKPCKEKKNYSKARNYFHINDYFIYVDKNGVTHDSIVVSDIKYEYEKHGFGGSCSYILNETMVIDCQSSLNGDSTIYATLTTGQFNVAARKNSKCYYLEYRYSNSIPKFLTHLKNDVFMESERKLIGNCKYEQIYEIEQYYKCYLQTDTSVIGNIKKFLPIAYIIKSDTFYLDRSNYLGKTYKIK